MATKQELEVQVNKLKDEVRKLRNEVKSTDATLENLNSEANGLIVTDEGFSLVTLKYDAESKEAIVTDVKELGKSIALASSKVKHAVIDHLVAITKRKV